MIFGSLVLEVFLLVSSALTLAEVWAILSHLFASRSRSRVNQLKSELYRIYIGDSSVYEFLHYAKSKADELALIDQLVSTNDLTLFVINGLGLEYVIIVDPIRTCETSLCFEELHDLLYEHELTLKSQEATTWSLVAMTNVATPRLNNKPSNKRVLPSHFSYNRGPHNSHPNSVSNQNLGNQNHGLAQEEL